MPLSHYRITMDLSVAAIAISATAILISVRSRKDILRNPSMLAYYILPNLLLATLPHPFHLAR